VPTADGSPLSLEDLQVGDEWVTPGRTVTETDIVNFAGLSGDFNPIHVDHEFASKTPYGKPIAHGLLVLSMSSGLAVQAVRVRTLALVAMTDWKFLGPVSPGDTITGTIRVESIEPRSRGRRGLVTWFRRITNQRGQTVQEGRVQTIVPARERVATEPAAPGGDES
jgi:acyl dehydratase